MSKSKSPEQQTSPPSVDDVTHDGGDPPEFSADVSFPEDPYFEPIVVGFRYVNNVSVDGDPATYDPYDDNESLTPILFSEPMDPTGSWTATPTPPSCSTGDSWHLKVFAYYKIGLGSVGNDSASIACS